MTTTEETEPRVFLAPINEPTRGRWTRVHDRADVTGEIERVREETGAEELILADAEGIPSTLIPRHGGVPVDKIAGFLGLADIHGTDVARAFVEIYGREVDPVKWEVEFQEAFRGVYDSKEAYAWEYLDMCMDFGDLPARYVDTSAVVTDFEASGEITFHRLDVDRIAVFANY